LKWTRPNAEASTLRTPKPKRARDAEAVIEKTAKARADAARAARSQPREEAMPIMAIYRSKDVDPETFNRFRAEAPIEPAPEGAIVHQVAFDDQGLLVIDVWEDEAQLKAFSESRLVPALNRLGITPAEPKLLQVHALWAAEDARQHNVAAPAPKPQSLPA
jgi:hypothetical protein